MSNTTTPPPTFGFLSSLDSIHFPTGGLLMMSLVSEPLNSAGLAILQWNSRVPLHADKFPNGFPFIGGTTSTQPPLQSPPPTPLLSLKKDTKNNRPAHVEDWGGEAISGGEKQPGADWSSQGFTGIVQGGAGIGGQIDQNFNDDLLKFGAAWPQPWPVYWDDLIAGSFGFLNLAALGVGTLNAYLFIGAAVDTAMRMSLVCNYFKKVTADDQLSLMMQANNIHNFSGLNPDFTVMYSTESGPAPSHVYLALSCGPKSLTIAKTNKFGN